MIFNYVLGLQDINKDEVNINYRAAVRAVIIKDKDILMVHNKKGDYKFPGGGVNKGESLEETVKREVREETGYVVSNVIGKLGTVIERKPDEFMKNSIFEMVSHYFHCEINDDKNVQQLDDYEAELDFQPVWIQIDEAIKLNEEILKLHVKDRNFWVERDTKVLKALKEYLNKRNAL